MKNRRTRSSWIAVLSMSLAAAFLFANVGRAEMVMFTITTNKTSYNPGELVEWQVLFDIGNSTAASNFGVAALSVDLADSFGDTLIAGTINKAAGPNFSGYDFSDPGTWDAATSKMYEITVLEFGQSTDVVGAHGSQLNNILLASGSLLATSPGQHTLSGTPGSSNLQFTAPNQSFVLAASYQSISFSNATFTVTAVPEPSSIVLMCLIALIRFGWRIAFGRCLRIRC